MVNRRAAAASALKCARRSASTSLRCALVAVVAGLSVLTVGAPVLATVDDPVDTRPPVTANEFFPEQRDVTDCIGVLERPGCGNENRGGWRQTAVFGAIVVGLVIVFGNVVRGVRRRR